MRECVKIMGNEDYIFYGDSFNAPYGVKSTEQVYQLSKKIVQRFLKQNVKAIANCLQYGNEVLRPQD